VNIHPAAEGLFSRIPGPRPLANRSSIRALRRLRSAISPQQTVLKPVPQHPCYDNSMIIKAVVRYENGLHEIVPLCMGAVYPPTIRITINRREYRSTVFDRDGDLRNGTPLYIERLGQVKKIE